MSILLCLILFWFLLTLALTLFMFQNWYYQRQSQPHTAHLEGGSQQLSARKVFASILLETLVFMRMELTYPLARWRDRHQPVLPDDYAPPILLVHGFGCNSSCLYALRKKLQHAGHRRVRAVSYAPAVANVHKLVPQIKAHIRQLLDDTGARKIHYIAHSMGGVLVRDVLRDPDFADCIDKVICLGSPHQGSRSSNILAPITRGAVQQMVYQSDYVQQLPATPGSARYYAINSQMDDLVLPVTSAVLPGMTHYAVDYLGHCSLLYSRQVFQLIERCLKDA